MSGVSFGYPWPLVYGHLCLALVMLPALYLARRRAWLRLAAGLLLIWGVAGFVAMNFVMRIDGRGELPTATFLAGGSGSVVDLGAGTGRSTLMVLEGRGGSAVTAVDSFAGSYAQHFGNRASAQELESAGHRKLRQNLEAAGVAGRARIVTADIRQLPFPADSFDAAISCYVIDHLRSRDIPVALGEARRVLKPGGDFLMMVAQKDNWMRLAFGPFTLHSRFPNPSTWIGLFTEAGFEVREHGQVPMTFYLLARRPE